MKYSDHDGPHPHYIGCEGCRKERRCNCCGRQAMDGFTWNERCTNGRCRECHSSVCTPGGNVSAGHGAGTAKRAHEQHAKVNG